MKYWLIHAQEPLPQARSVQSRRLWRTNTIAEMLADRGHQVLRWRSAFSHYEKRPLVEGSVRARFDNVEYQFLAGPPYPRNIGPARVRHHRAIAAEFTRIAGSMGEKPDAIHVGNVPLELCEAVVRFGKERNVPVIVDIRDLWPDIYLDLVPNQLHFLRPLVRQLLHFSYRSARYSMANAAAISGITEPFVDWGVRLSGRPRRTSDRVFHMSYPKIGIQPDLEDVRALQAKLGLYGDEFIACYFGNIGYQSDFDTLVEAGRRLPADSRIRIIICGDGPKLSSLRRDAADVEKVILPGWIDSFDIQQLMRLASVGLLPFKDSDNYVLNMPNKFSEYLSGGLSLACGVRGEMANQVRKHDCGFIYKNGDAAGLTDNLQSLADSPERTSSMRERSRRLFQTEFDCNVVYSELCSYLEDWTTRSLERSDSR